MATYIRKKGQRGRGTRLFTDPNTKVSLDRQEWAELLEISPVSFYARIKKWGEDSPNPYREGKQKGTSTGRPRKEPLPRQTPRSRALPIDSKPHSIDSRSARYKHPTYLFRAVGNLWWDAVDPRSNLVVVEQIVELKSSGFGWNPYNGFEGNTRQEVTQKVIEAISSGAGIENFVLSGLAW